MRGWLREAEALVLVAVGGSAGSSLRYFLELLGDDVVATLAANVLGSLLLGFLLYEAIHVGVVSRRGRTLMGSGFLASFTTYSTFALQTWTNPGFAVVIVGANYVLGFGAVLVGRRFVFAWGGVEA